MEVVYKTSAHFRHTLAHILRGIANKHTREAVCISLTECDLMHCELNVMWELFVENNK